MSDEKPTVIDELAQLLAKQIAGGMTVIRLNVGPAWKDMVPEERAAAYLALHRSPQRLRWSSKRSDNPPRTGRPKRSIREVLDELDASPMSEAKP